MSDFISPRQITFRICLDFSRIYVDIFLQRSMADFKPVMLLFDMVFVHVSRCLIFEVHQACSVYKTSVVSSVALNRSDPYIIARCVPFVKNIFRFFEAFFLVSVGARPLPQRARI